MRVVLDTNLLISALAFPGSKPDQILQRVRRREMDLFNSSFILGELEPGGRIHLVEAMDDDNRILECAVAARANYLVPGDPVHLLPLRSVQGIPIITPAAFVALSDPAGPALERRS